MKNIAAILIMISLIAGSAQAARQANKLADRPNAIAKAAQRRQLGGMPLLDIVQGLYASGIKRQTEIGDEQVAKIIPFMNEYLRERNEIEGPRRMRALNQLRQAVNRGGTDEELARLTHEFDRINEDARTAQDRFFANVDPLLTVRQRARLRIFHVNMDDQIRRLIQAAQSPGPPPAAPQTRRPNAP